jgi:hypothetical protein
MNGEYLKPISNLSICQVCPEYTYSLIKEFDYICRPCDQRKMLCKGGNGLGNNIIIVNKGFWRGKSSLNEVDIYECLDFKTFGDSSVCKGG